jgi:hypothetical protein
MPGGSSGKRKRGSWLSGEKQNWPGVGAFNRGNYGSEGVPLGDVGVWGSAAAGVGCTEAVPLRVPIITLVLLTLGSSFSTAGASICFRSHTRMPLLLCLRFAWFGKEKKNKKKFEFRSLFFEFISFGLLSITPDYSSRGDRYSSRAILIWQFCGPALLPQTALAGPSGPIVFSAFRGSVRTGGSVPTGDQWGSRDQCQRGISAYGGSVPTGDQCLRGM